VSSQAWLNPWLGVDSLNLLAQGLSPQEVVDRVIAEDVGGEFRQIAVVDSQGRSAAFTGSETDAWCGHRTGAGYATAGNLLFGPETVDAIAETFEANPDEILPERLVRALSAGQAAGGDKRGRQSAALLVYNKLELPYVTLRVDDHPDPVAELRRILDMAKEHTLPFGERLSSSKAPRTPEEIRERQRLLAQQAQQKEAKT
jgi:uncharacterized Ntn-hydrolase superfamily protein